MFNPMTLEGKTIVVTGAGQGIGRAVANTIMKLGGRVVAVDRNQDGLNEFQGEAPADRLIIAVGDVTDDDFVTATVDEAAEWGGRIDGLVNNAGISRPAMIHKMDKGTWNAVVDVNLTAPFMFLQAVGRKMLARLEEGGQASGSIINISSDAGRRWPGQLCSSKGRNQRPHHVGRARMGGQGNPRQLGCLRRRGDPDDRGRQGREVS